MAFDDWEETMTAEQLDALEAQGADVTELRAKLKARQEIVYSVNLGKLDPYKIVPRDTETQFFKDTAGSAPLFGKDKWKAKFENAPLVYGSVVQANSSLWRPGVNEGLPAVFVFALDSAHQYNIEWLRGVSEIISALKEAEDSEIPDDHKELIHTLRDDQSMFCFKLGKSLIQEADVWCATYAFQRQSDLPNMCLPTDGIVPFLLTEQPREGYGVQFAMIPSVHYI